MTSLLRSSVGFVLTLEGKPEGKARPRFGKGGRVYTPTPTKLAESRIIDAWTSVGQPRLEGPIGLAVELHVCRARDHFRADGTTLSAKGERYPWPTGKKPDVDNAVKLVMDALNRRAYRDDVDVVNATITRRWTPDGWERTIVRVRSMVTPDAPATELQGSR